MTSTTSRTPSLTPSRSPTPQAPVQPDHFYGSEAPLPPSPATDERPWLDPADDPLAQRGIPVFKPTMDEFRNFEAYMNRVECWGMRSGIVKVIPPKEWTDALPPLNSQLAEVKLRNPIEQEMMGHGGLFRQQNIEKRRVMSVREWAELCAKEELRAPGVKDVGLHARATNGTARTKTRKSARKTREPETAEPEMTPAVMVKEEDEGEEGIAVHGIVDEEAASKSLASPPTSAVAPPTPITPCETLPATEAQDRHSAAPSAAGSAAGTSRPSTPDTVAAQDDAPKRKGKRIPQSKEAREAAMARRVEKDKEFLAHFDPHKDWLPPNTTNDDYTVDFCKELERRYWRNCGLGRPAWYGADMAGSLFTDETKSWNVAHLESALSRLLPSSNKGLPGVNTPYLYFGMWRATFAWHVEDMDLFSINYIHFGAPKFWYAVPQGRAIALEHTMKGYFPKDTSNCSQFLRHKSYLASPKVLTTASCRPNFLVQREGEFVITYPRGYHAGFNLGFNCAESVNFALDSWLSMGRVAKACECVDFSVRIDVDQLLQDRAAERQQADAMARGEGEGESETRALTAFEDPGSTEADAQADTELVAEQEPQATPNVDEEEGTSTRPKASRKRKSDSVDGAPRPKRSRTKTAKAEHASGPSSPSKPPKVTLKLGPKPQESDVFPCCLCISTEREGLLRVHNPPVWQKEGQSGEGSAATSNWQAHEECANVIPETWVDEIEVGSALPDGTIPKERMVFGTDAIPRDRWNLKCNACLKTRHRAHGAPIQCTKGKCPKAYHVSCARNGSDAGISYRVLREVENDVLLSDPQQTSTDVNMDTDENAEVLSLVKKLEVEVLCPQHNPAMLEAKKAAKQDKIRSMLAALPPMTRIKLRVSAGVFEVSLVRVVEETGCVEVLWDRGHKREFKWSSVVFGNSDNVVGQKPTEMAPEPPAAPAVPAPAAVISSHPSSFYLPLGSSTSVEVRSQAYAASSAGVAPAYSQTYKVSYYQPYPSTSYQPHAAYQSGAWTYPYTGQSQTQSHYAPAPAPGPSHPQSVGGPSQYPGSSAYDTTYPTGRYAYPVSSYSQQPGPQVIPRADASAQHYSTQSYPYTQPNGYVSHQPAPYTQPPVNAGTQAYPASNQHAGHMAPSPQVQTASSNVYHESTSQHTSRSQTPASHPGLQELRWQQPYQGPKIAPRTSRPASRASSVHVQSGNTSPSQSARPMDPSRATQHGAPPQLTPLQSGTSTPVPPVLT